jgi:hypothetical protein
MLLEESQIDVWPTGNGTQQCVPVQERVFTIRRREDGQYVSTDEQDSHFGENDSLFLTIVSATREAARAARDQGCRVRIEVEKPDGEWGYLFTVEPPSLPS